MYWLLWAQYCDRSGDPEFLGLFSSEQEANGVKEMLAVTIPAMALHVTEVQKRRFLTGEWGA